MQRSTLYYILSISFIAILFCCCDRQQQEKTLLPELQQAEAVMEIKPDSALHILEQMPVPSGFDKLQHATWSLLLAQARYKNYIDPPSDTLINTAYNYFIKQDDAHRKALSLYMKGILSKTNNNLEEELQYLLEASEEVEKTDDYPLGYFINATLGTIHAYRVLHEHAEKFYQKAYEYAKLDGNNINMASSLSFLARVHSLTHNYNKAIEYYKEAVELQKDNKNSRTYIRLLTELSGIYILTENYPKALEHAVEASNISKKLNLSTAISDFAIGRIYTLTGNADSAYHYLSKSLDANNLYTRRTAFVLLTSLSKDKNDYKLAMQYSDSARHYNDSIQSIEQRNKLIEMQAKYDQERVINEKNQLQMEKDSIVTNTMIALACLLIITLIVIYIYQRKLLQKERTIQKKEEQIRMYTLKVHENESLIKRNEERIQELTAEMQQNLEIQELLTEQQSELADLQKQNELLTKENTSLEKSITTFSDTLKEKNRELDALSYLSAKSQYLQERENFLTKQLIKKIKVLSDLKAAPKYINDAQWEEVKEAVDWLYDGYTKNLIKDIPSLTESDIQICCLIKLRLNVSEIATLLGISPTSVSKRKLRLKERIIQETGKKMGGNQTLDTWLWEYSPVNYPQRSQIKDVAFWKVKNHQTKRSI